MDGCGGRFYNRRWFLSLGDCLLGVRVQPIFAVGLGYALGLRFAPWCVPPYMAFWLRLKINATNHLLRAGHFCGRARLCLGTPLYSVALVCANTFHGIRICLKNNATITCREQPIFEVGLGCALGLRFDPRWLRLKIKATNHLCRGQHVLW